MRCSHLAAFVALTMTASGAFVLGCFGSADDCEITLACGATPGTGPTTSSSSGGGGSAGDACVPSENQGPVSEDCGVFVELGGVDTDPGTQSKPVQTLAKAMQLAKSGGGRVYVCGQVFKEPLEVPPGMSIFGGLDCKSDWSYNAANRTSIETEAGVVPLKLMKGSNGIRLEDVNARSADAAAPGGSSIAVIADGATATITRCDFMAGAGAAGEKGTTPTDDIGSIDNPDAPDIKGGDGVNACMPSSTGGPGKANTLCVEAVGGNGGDGGLAAANGSAGTDGAPAGDANIGKGGSVDANGVCAPGGYGQDGVVGAAGAGAAATDVGVLSATGYVGAAGGDGSKGLPGQGGGGGGGGKGKVGCNGASGGGGGAGGCGGGGGLGGMAGGSSIALISLDASLTLNEVKLKAGNGGAGGDGGDGQLGGIGGSGGKGGLLVAGTTKGCAGGDGGSGGIGGQGGGGRGGHSLGVAYAGKAPPKASISVGMAGVGGVGAGAAGSGAAGEATNMLQFP